MISMYAVWPHIGWLVRILRLQCESSWDRIIALSQRFGIWRVQFLEQRSCPLVLVVTASSGVSCSGGTKVSSASNEQTLGDTGRNCSRVCKIINICWTMLLARRQKKTNKSQYKNKWDITTSLKKSAVYELLIATLRIKWK